MFIKTVSTTSGINPIQFAETGGVFYWILNTGSSTIYASTKAAFTAGDDGVVSLGPKESRRLETNNDTIYILGEGQVEIHNQRDGICSFKQAPTSSGGGGTIDAYTKTESDAKYAAKTDVPDSYTKNESDAKYAQKTDVPDAYTKTESDAKYAAKTDVPDSYTKNESDAKYAQKTDVVPYKMGMDFGMCTSAAETTVKSVTTQHKVVPTLGAVFAVQFNNAVPAKASLNINGLTGGIQYRGGNIPNGVINAGDIVTFMYHSSSGANIFDVISIENGGNAKTVNGFTVGCNVPADAVFTPPDLSGYASKALYGDTTINVGREAGSDVGEYSTAFGHNTIASGYNAYSQGTGTKASGVSSHAEGDGAIASDSAAHAEGISTQATANASHAEGVGTTASGAWSHAEGDNTTASKDASHAEGNETVASGISSHAEGSSTQATANASHAEGNKTVASGNTSHAEGSNTEASGTWSHAEGYYTTASKDASHAEGNETVANGVSSHAEGSTTTASGISSHAEGSSTTASGFASHAEGQFTIANNDAEHASGKYNVSNEDTLFSVGDGTNSDNRHNAFEITKTGGKLHDRDIGISFTPAESDAIRIEIPDGVDAAQWLKQNAKSGMLYYISTKSSRTGLPNASAEWMWFSYDGNRYFARAWTGDTHTADFVLDVTNSIGGWKEISYTPIKSTPFSGTTNEYGNVVFTAVGNKIPVFAECSPYCGIPLCFNDNYWIHCIDPITNNNSIAANTAVTGTVYYVEI